MNYEIIWHEDTIEDLRKFPLKESKRIISKIEQYLSENPIQLGKSLRGKLKGLYRYRIGRYRVIYQINQSECKIIVIRVGKRDEIYGS